MSEHILDDPDFPIWFVGGCVRDWKQDEMDGLPRREKHHDIDGLCINAKSVEEVEAWMRAKNCRIFDLNRFNIVRGFLPGVGPIDLSPPRADIGVADGRRPESVILATPEEDLARRDFTVNAMAMTMQGELIDPHGGMSDLAAKRLTFVGDAHERLREDAFRAFRALRFVVCKEFFMDREDMRAIQQLPVSAFDATSDDLIVDELEKCMRADSRRTLNLLHTSFSALDDVVWSRGTIWFKPSREQRKPTTKTQDKETGNE